MKENTTTMTPLQNAAFQTIAFLDLFDFSPTLLELEQWLLQPKKISPSSIHTTIPTTPLSTLQFAIESDSRIEHSQGLYYLRGHNALVHLRKQKYNFTEEKWKHTKKYLRLIASMPHVRALFLANAMGWSNARHESDIDIVIVTTPQRIWTCRFFTAGIMKLLRQRPGEQASHRALCLSFYVTDDNLDLEQYRINDNDIPFAFWVSQQYPIYDPQNLYQQLYQQNKHWLQRVFVQLHWPSPTARRQIKPYRGLHIIQSLMELLPLETITRSIQKHLLPEVLKNQANTNTHVVINDRVLKLHTTDHRQKQLTTWEQRCNTTPST